MTKTRWRLLTFFGTALFPFVTLAVLLGGELLLAWEEWKEGEGTGRLVELYQWGT